MSRECQSTDVGLSMTELPTGLSSNDTSSTTNHTSTQQREQYVPAAHLVHKYQSYCLGTLGTEDWGRYLWDNREEGEYVRYRSSFFLPGTREADEQEACKKAWLNHNQKVEGEEAKICPIFWKFYEMMSQRGLKGIDPLPFITKREPDGTLDHWTLRDYPKEGWIAFDRHARRRRFCDKPVEGVELCRKKFS